MSSNDTDLSGPDLTRGIPTSRLADGETITGHAHGESVLLARRGDEFFAIGAKCTHYGGPLSEGLIIGDTVRCPWHHACFSLRTGEALQAPALNPVSCWRVDCHDDTVFVLDKSNAESNRPGPDRPNRARGDDRPSEIVIVGAGAAGDAAVEMLRRKSFDGRIILFGDDGSAPYDRPNLSKDFLAGTAPDEWLPLRASSFYVDNDIELELGKRVTTIETEPGRISLDDGATYSFDRLLLATGATPVNLHVPGADLPHVHNLRTLADCRAILSRETCRRVAVIGAGFIGMEVAASLRSRGIDVHVVARQSRPLEHVFGTGLGNMLRALHEEHGVVFHMEQSVTAIHPHSVTLSGGEDVAADLVVVGAGVRPATALAEDAGLAVDDGVQVNEYLETSIPGIFAAGDVACWPDSRSSRYVRIEHWVVAQRQGQVAALNMLGQNRVYDQVPFFWTQQYDVPIAYVGHAPSWDRVDVVGSIQDRDCLIAYRRAGKTLAVASIFRDLESLEAEAAMQRDDERALRILIPPSQDGA